MKLKFLLELSCCHCQLGKIIVSGEMRAHNSPHRRGVNIQLIFIELPLCMHCVDNNSHQFLTYSHSYAISIIIIFGTQQVLTPSQTRVPSANGHYSIRWCLCGNQRKPLQIIIVPTENPRST